MPMTKLVTFEDLPEGAVFWAEEVVADAGAMVDYARQYDPWPFHVDADAAKQTSFGGLVASAGYTFSLWCRALHSIIRTPGAEWAFLGGYDLHVKLLQPVRPGDRLRLKVSISGKRPSSKLGRGHVDSSHVFLKQDGVPVFNVELGFLIATRTPT
jgi:acyl dehydratase